MRNEKENLAQLYIYSYPERNAGSQDTRFLGDTVPKVRAANINESMQRYS